MAYEMSRPAMRSTCTWCRLRTCHWQQLTEPRDLWIRNTQRVRKSKGTPSNTAANTLTCDPDALRRSPRDSPRGHTACRGPLVDEVDKICRTSRASHETTRLSASAAVQCLSWSPAVPCPCAWCAGNIKRLNLQNHLTTPT
jgi:hypothetical protein